MDMDVIKEKPRRGDQTPRQRLGKGIVPAPPRSSSHDGPSSGCTAGSGEILATARTQVKGDLREEKREERTERMEKESDVEVVEVEEDGFFVGGTKDGRRGATPLPSNSEVEGRRERPPASLLSEDERADLSSLDPDELQTEISQYYSEWRRGKDLMYDGEPGELLRYHFRATQTLVVELVRRWYRERKAVRELAEEMSRPKGGAEGSCPSSGPGGDGGSERIEEEKERKDEDDALVRSIVAEVEAAMDRKLLAFRAGLREVLQAVTGRRGEIVGSQRGEVSGAPPVSGRAEERREKEKGRGR